MTHSVIDVGSNLNENLERWSGALSRGGDKLKVFKVVYSSKRKQWTAKEISEALGGAIHRYKVPNVAGKLVGDGILQQLAGSWPVVYTKNHDIQHYRNRILSLANNGRKRRALPTKRKTQVNVKVRAFGKQPKPGEAVEITIDDIDQFSRVRKKHKQLSLLKPLSEERFKRGLLKLLGETGKFLDSGVERDDLITNKLKMRGKRYVAAFALKGPGLKTKIMTPAKWGKNGNQIQKLVSAPARVFMLQAEKQFHEDSLEQLQNLVEHKANSRRRKLYYGHIDRTDSLRLRRAYPEFF
jgi:hypothetical protein